MEYSILNKQITNSRGRQGGYGAESAFIRDYIGKCSWWPGGRIPVNSEWTVPRDRGNDLARRVLTLGGGKRGGQVPAQSAGG